MKKKKKNNKYKITVRKFFGHLHVVNKHRFKVFCLCCRAGEVWRGLIHDLSKYSFTEFFESARYFVGDRSPIVVCKKVNGYSKAWLHHKGRNKHHPEYWIDVSLPEKTILMPYKYAAEMICDKLAAGIVYNGKAWTKDSQIKYYMKERETSMLNPKIDRFLIEVFTEVSERGIDETLTKHNIRQIYDNCCVELEKLDENKIQAVG